MIPRMRLAEAVMARFRRAEEPELPVFEPTELRIIEWLRGNVQAKDSLTEWITGRIEGRGLLPSSTPHEAAIKEGQDIEARQIARRLRELFAAPILSGSEDE